MKFSKISTLAMLSASSLFSLSLNAKTLIIDDFLQYQDTSNIKFDLAHSQPSKRLTPYSSQFVAVSENFYKDGAPGCLPLTLKNSQQIFTRFLRCKTGKDFDALNEFEKRKYPENIKEEYVEKYKKHIEKLNEYIDSIDRVEFRKFFTLFKSSKYNFDKSYYGIDSDTEYWSGNLYVDKNMDYYLIPASIQGEYNLRSKFNESFVKDVFDRYVHDGGKYNLVLDMPVSIAEKLYEISGGDSDVMSVSSDIPVIISNMVFEKENRCIVSKYDNCFRPVFEDFSFEIVSGRKGNKMDRFYYIGYNLKLNRDISQELGRELKDRDNPYDINSRNILFKTNGVMVMDEDENGRVNYVYSLEAVND